MAFRANDSCLRGIVYLMYTERQKLISRLATPKLATPKNEHLHCWTSIHAILL